jgi:hypothetical protein
VQLLVQPVIWQVCVPTHASEQPPPGQSTVHPCALLHVIWQPPPAQCCVQVPDIAHV